MTELEELRKRAKKENCSEYFIDFLETVYNDPLQNTEFKEVCVNALEEENPRRNINNKVVSEIWKAQDEHDIYVVYQTKCDRFEKRILEETFPVLINELQN